MRDIGRRGLLTATAGLLAAPAIVRAEGQAGVALVIGNSKYKWEASLPNVKRDAPDVAKRFQALGLKTELLQDAGQDAMRAAIDKFTAGARGANLAAFYFAGHGASWDNDTYLVPQDADLGNPNTVRSLLPVRSVSDATKEAQHRLLVFDNCRNNPADGWRQRAAMESSLIAKTELAATALQGQNTLLMFSTAPGRVAVDGPAGENSPFAATFLRQLGGSVDLQALPAKLRRDLLIATEGRQVLWDQNTYAQPFLLAGSSNHQPANSRDKVAAEAAPPTASSQIVELPKAYAFAREKGLVLPPGLVAFRPPASASDSQKIGSFKSMFKVRVGTSYGGNDGYSIEPFLLVVLTVSNGNTAEIMFSTNDHKRQAGLAGSGTMWRYSPATLSGPRLEFIFGAAGPAFPNWLKWSDANSGVFTGGVTSNATGGTRFTYDFTRLD
jgi:hypothetical protein